MVINMKFEKNKLFAAAVNPRTNHFVMALTALVNFPMKINSGNIVMHTKVAKIVLSGEPDISSPLAFAEGLFYFYRLFLYEKKDF